MNLRAVGLMLGIVLLLVAGFLLVPCIVALVYSEIDSLKHFLASAGLTAAVGAGLAYYYRGSGLTNDGRPDYFRREGLAVVGLSWVVAGIPGALPFMFDGVLSSFPDAFFESVSGFTTTGSTVMAPEQIDGMSHALAFWRSFTHWLGGFGIVMVFVILFPTGGRSLFRSEIPGIAREAGHQRVRDSALGLARIYVGITVIEFGLLMLTGISTFDAVIHSIGTIPTGGFSNHSEGIKYFQYVVDANGEFILDAAGRRQTVQSAMSISVEVIITAFMFLCGFNFAIYDKLLRAGIRPAWRTLSNSTEARAYTAIVVGATLVIAIRLWFWGGSGGEADDPDGDYRSFLLAIKDSAFLVVSLGSSTGYGTENFDRWPQICRVILMFLAVIGACAGSTGGGIKVVRVLIVGKAAIAGVRRFIRPRAIVTVRMDGQVIDEGVVASVSGYFGLWVLVFLGGTLFMSCYEQFDLVTASTAVLATLNNIGPGLNMVGPSVNFAEIPDLPKLVLTMFMILGRLEFYAVVALFVPGFWRR